MNPAKVLNPPTDVTAAHTLATGALTSNVAGMVTSALFLGDNSAIAAEAAQRTASETNAAMERRTFEEVIRRSPA
jgi:hypothetical protein